MKKSTISAPEASKNLSEETIHSAERELQNLLNYGGINLTQPPSPGRLSIDFRQGDLSQEIRQMRRLSDAFSRLADALQGLPEGSHSHNPSAAAIEFALSDDEGIAFLECFNEGDFEAIREEWPDAPEEVFVGADPEHYVSKALFYAD